MKRLVTSLLFLAATAGAGPCVQVYYDRPTEQVPDHRIGRVHALYLENLLGHFPDWKVRTLPLDAYQAGDLNRCEASAYLGTNYFAKIPDAFLTDFAKSERRLLWAGYGVWRLEERTEKLWGFKFQKLSILADTKDAEGFPGFYRFIDYRGERFKKFAQWRGTGATRTLDAAWEQTVVVPNSDADRRNVVAWAEHSTKGDRVPYLLHRDRRWYIADSPFSYATEEDRYLIFADLLFDWLGEEPRYKDKRPALLRLEDVHPLVPTWQIKIAADLFHRLGAKFTISLVPVFSDPFGVKASAPEERDVSIAGSPEFVAALEYARKKGASFILHGLSHQLGNQKNPWNGLTGDDFEFWDRVRNRPVAEESVRWVQNRVEDGVALVNAANRKFGSSIKLMGWLTPHYQCSALACSVFGLLWDWTVGRNIYFLHENNRTGLGAIEALPGGDRAKRTAALAKLSVKADPTDEPNGQFFPYEIYGDTYGQRILPENVGNVQPYMNEQVFRVQTPQDIVDALRRNRALRDVWGSWFVHPFRLNGKAGEGIGEFAGDTRTLERMIRAVHENGYEFVDLDTWVTANKDRRRVPPEVAER